MLKRFLLSCACALIPFGLFGGEPTLEQMQSVHQSLVTQGNSVVTKKPAVSWSPSTAFANQAFVLWDYAEDIHDLQSARTHWQNLISFIQANKITRVISYIKSPASFSFFADTNPPTQGFAYYAAQLPSSCQLAVLFDCVSFVLTGIDDPNPDNSYPGYDPLPSYFSNLPEKMLWTQRMLAQGVKIAEVVLDPENACTTTHAGNPEYQLLIDFMDYYRTSNSLTNLKLGMTFGVDAHSVTFCNLSNFPIDDTIYTSYGALPGSNFPPQADPQWRPGTTNPVLDHVYIQVYDPQMPYIFTLSSNPSLAATYLLHNFRDEPYLLGTGTISFTNGSTAVTGTGTQFLGHTVNKVLLDAILDEMPVGLSVGTRIGLCDGGASSNTAFTVNSPITAPTQSNVPFYQTEIINKWTFPYITTTMANNIYLMFSFENSTTGNALYFGSWTVDQFVSFVQSFYSQGQTSLPIYMQDASTSIPLPNNFAIYDFNIFESTYDVGSP